MSKKKTITTYTISRAEIEQAILEVFKKKHPELEDEFEAELAINYGGGHRLARGSSLEATLEFVEEKEK